MARPARAILIGIDEYPEDFPTLDSAVQDATAMENLLKNDLGMTEGITLLTNSKATRSQIVDTILSLEQDKSLKRGEPILIFFSGLAANGAPEGSAETVKIGSICPADVDKAGGISDEALLQLLDRVVRTCGNNITIFLDCTASLFLWGSPASCTIFAPDEADETQAGGAFTQALISAFRERKSTLNQLTPWALRGTIQAFMSNIPVRCWGTNVNRKLFSLQGEQGHHALIQCYQAGDGTIILGAGTAHGVHTGAVYGAYPSNLKSGMTRLAGLTVRSLNDDNITSVLQVNGETRLPPFFYATEERGYADPVKVFLAGAGDQKPNLENLAAWEEAPEAEAQITAKKVDSNKIGFVWNGTGNYTRERLNGDTVYRDGDSGSIRRFMRRAARFNSIVFAPGPSNSAIASRLKVQLLEVDGDGTGNVLPSDKFDVGLGEYKDLRCNKTDTLGPYYLVLTNDNPFPLWPYIIVCDPAGFTIRTWYAPLLGSYTPPLKENGTLTVGRNDGRFSIFFEWQSGRNLDFLHIKIFVTQEKTDFGSLAQWFTSPTEETLRGFRKEEYAPGSTISEFNDASQLEIEVPTIPDGRDPKRQLAWASRLITLVPRYAEETNDVPDN